MKLLKCSSFLSYVLTTRYFSNRGPDTHTLSHKWLTTDDYCCYECRHCLYTNALINVTPEHNLNIHSSVAVERNQVQRGEIPACFFDY